MKRRKFITQTSKVVGGIAAISIGGFALFKPKGSSGNYSPFFKNLNNTLQRYHRKIPFLLVDLDAVDHNIAKVKELIPAKADFRIVVKSLPSKELVTYTMQKSDTKKLMVFHQPFLSQLSQDADETIDVLMGKPMPVRTAAYYYKTLKPSNGFNPAIQLQWLVDTKERVLEYINLAKTASLHLLLNVEIDVGLHRGGFNNLTDLESVLQLISENREHVSFSGFMGYDPHIVKVPSFLLSREKAFDNMRTYYNACKELVRTKFPEMWHDNLTFNGAGSPTIALHSDNESPLNDISAGSFAVKPTDFDIDTLKQFKPASYIATPILKKQKNSTLPSLENMTGLLNFWDSNMKNSYFIYGGSWMANYHEPKGIKGNPIFGKSTNQVMVNASNDTDLDVGDFVFLRPHQSEFVFLQFENIIAFRGSKILEEWPLFN